MGNSHITLDTRGINAGTPEGRRALQNAAKVERTLGGRHPGDAGAVRAVNAKARRLAADVNRVSAAHRTETAKRAAGDRFVRNLVRSRYGR